MTLAVLVEQILTRERLVADRAAELVGVHVENIVPRQVVQPRVLLGTNVTGEFSPVGVTSLMVLQISFLSECFFAGAADDLITFILFCIHMTCQFFTRRKFLLTKNADKFLWLFVPLYIFHKVWIGHDLVQEGIFQFVLWLGGGICRDVVNMIGRIILC